MQGKGYIWKMSELGKVYYPKEGVCLSEQVTVQYVEYPWITCFEVEGIDIIKEK